VEGSEKREGVGLGDGKFGHPTLEKERGIEYKKKRKGSPPQWKGKPTARQKERQALRWKKGKA